MRFSVRLRQRLRAGVAVALCVVATHSTITRTLPGAPGMLLWRDGRLTPQPFTSLRWTFERDCVARETERFSTVRALLPKTGVLGYVGAVHGEACRFAVQEVLAPLLVIDLETPPWTGPFPPARLHVPSPPPLTVVDSTLPNGASWLRQHDEARIVMTTSSGIVLVAEAK